MILLINGPFGVGKTTAANMLVERLPNAVIYNPESIGFALRRLPTPFRKANDYQDLPLWRNLVPLMAKLKRVRRTNLVMPMTIWRRDYIEEITTGLRRVDPDLRIFQLTATESELRRRIVSDLEDEPARPWRVAHMERGLAMAGNPVFGEEVETDGRMPAEVAEEIVFRLATASRRSISP